MPTYEYCCEKCGHVFEELQKITDDSLKICPKCKAPKLRRSPGGGIGLSFQGKGFYITDYGPKKESSSSEPSKPSTDASPPKSCGCGKPSGSCGS